MTSFVQRPGIRMGVYPQRIESVATPLERVGGAWLVRGAQWFSNRRYDLPAIVAQVEKESAGLAPLDSAQLQLKREQIRKSLMRDGLQSELILRCFALVGEYAWRVMNMRYYDEQFFGAWVIAKGNMAEMATGEGKTFTATLAAATAALAGIPVHVITTNEYLAKRDAEQMRPLYEALGLQSTAIEESMDNPTKRLAYRSNVVHCTNKQVAFDYLRDRLITRNESGPLSLKFGRAHKEQKLVLQGLCFAIVDEADSVLIDDARTPLILSQEHRDDAQEHIYQQAIELAREMTAGQDFILRTREHSLEITAAGSDWLTERTKKLDGIWSGQRHREFLLHQALSALHLFRLDAHYLVREGKVEIIDRNTGRTMSDRSWQRGLHQMIECKEGCEMSGQKETLASISYQRFFKRYLHLGGMSGTLSQVAGEMRSVYGLQLSCVPTHRPNLRKDRGLTLLRGVADKWLYALGRVEKIHGTGQPVLLGTGSLRDSELLSAFLSRRGLAHEVLNARADDEEARIVELAGQKNQITIATNMAGRGTDIKLGPEVAQLGGLHIIATDCHEEYRVDRQLSGRSARQGDPGSNEVIVSLADPLLKDFYPEGLLSWLGARLERGRTFPRPLRKLLVKLPQNAMARRRRIERQDVMQMDEKLGRILAYSGPVE
ncbi:MAG: hypothetical protein AB8B81_01750 [Halioglobus sp.]